MPTVATSRMWHRCLGHIYSARLYKMKQALDGTSLPEVVKIEKSASIVCCEGKQVNLLYQQISSKSQGVLKLIRADVNGPMERLSIGKSKYYALFVDAYSKMTFVYFLKTKDEVFTQFKCFQSIIEKQTDRKIKIIRTDNGGESCSLEF